MFNKNNFCHVASNNRNDVKVGVFVYKTTDELDTVKTSGYFNEKIVDINLHDLIIHEWHDAADRTKVQYNLLCVTERTLDNVGTTVIHNAWDESVHDMLQAIDAVLNNLPNVYVKQDGTSVMSAPLKFKAGSLRGAIGPSFGGVELYTLNNDDTLSLVPVARITNTAFTPHTDNAQDVGSTTRKWKDAYIARVITAVINNGFDIAVPVTNQADTLALKSQVDTAANSGSQLTNKGVWYAKMYAATVVPTGAEYDGRNYADFSQTDINGDPIIVLYEGQSGSWVQTQTITPPADYNGYVTITSKIWDITEQSGQQGGLILWAFNTKTFTPYPKIISFEDAALTGIPTAPNLSAGSPNNQIVNKQSLEDAIAANPQANQSLSNLDSTGQNITNWSSNVSNCVVEIPQNIKLELNAGTLTLKAGSTVYTPNGQATYDTTDITTDVELLSSTTAGYATGKYLLFYNSTLNKIKCVESYNNCQSGSYDGSQYCMFYNTSYNTIKYTDDSGSTWEDGYSLPFALAIVTNGTGITKIEQAFDGIGYMGQTFFTLPGLSVLCPNGRNSNGTLNSNKITKTSVKRTSSGVSGTAVGYVIGGTNLSYGTLFYDEKENFLINQNFGTKEPNSAIIATYTVENDIIVEFHPKTVFHAVDTNESDYVVETQLPTAQNDYTWYRKYKSGWVEQGGYYNGNISAGSTASVSLPITMADANYTCIITGEQNSSNWAYGVLADGSRTTTGFSIFAGGGGSSDKLKGATWQVSGVAA